MELITKNQVFLLSLTQALSSSLENKNKQIIHLHHKDKKD
jgi:hypothetical protein